MEVTTILGLSLFGFAFLICWVVFWAHADIYWSWNSFLCLGIAIILPIVLAGTIFLLI